MVLFPEPTKKKNEMVISEPTKIRDMMVIRELKKKGNQQRKEMRW